MEIEQKLDLTEYVPESFGTADCVVINDNLMEVIDLKYGKVFQYMLNGISNLCFMGLELCRNMIQCTI